MFWCRVDHGRHHLLSLTDAILYVAPCLQFRGHNSINMAKACISNSGLFVWEICIRKLMCQTAEGPLTSHALLTRQNKIYCRSKTRPLPHQQDVLIIFWHVSELHNAISLQIQSLWDSFVLYVNFKACSLSSQLEQETTFNWVFLGYSWLNFRISWLEFVRLSPPLMNSLQACFARSEAASQVCGAWWPLTCHALWV